MNAKKMIAAIAVMSATTSAFAVGSDELATHADVQSTKTRAEVRAELERSKADGSYDLAHQQYEGQYPQATLMARSKARAAELARSGNGAKNN